MIKIVLNLLLLLCLVPNLAGCEALRFYPQAMWGQVSVLHKREPVHEVLQDDQLSLATRRGLESSRLVLAFAQDELGLEVGERYSTYVELEGRYVVWNVFLAKANSLEGKHWCYPIAGCAPYRGYFKQSSAHALAKRYAARGYETYVGPVPAYSTLGWFDDPLMSSFVAWPDAQLASLLLHELAHSEVWVDSDVAFNESFASFVGARGTQAWLRSLGRESDYLDNQSKQAQWRSFRQFLLRAKSRLSDFYQSRIGDFGEADVAQKDRLIETLRSCYQNNLAKLGGGRFDFVMEKQFNNAYLVSIATYADYVSAFRVLFLRSNESWGHFFEEVRVLAQMPELQRQQELDALTNAAVELDSSGQQPVTHGRDDNHTEEIYCEAFADHGLDGKAPG